MKFDCQNVLTQFASFSVEELTDSEAASLLTHLEECEPCKGQWLLFEKTLMVTTQSGPRDEDVEQVRSQQMWLVCREHARKNTEKHALPAESQPAHADNAHVAPNSNASPHAKNQEQGAHSEAPILVAPRVGMMLVGGALLLLTSAHFLAPRPAPAQNATLPPMPAQLQTVGFQALPRHSASLVDYGATLGFDALSDHVQPTLISAPVQNARSVPTVRVP